MYNAVYYIQDFFARPKIAKQANMVPENDAAKLNSYCNRCMFLRARNGNTYWYCFLKDIKYLANARNVLANNGIRAKLHFSRYDNYMSGRQPALRVRASRVAQNSFVKYMDMVKDAEMRKAQFIGNAANENVK